MKENVVTPETLWERLGEGDFRRGYIEQSMSYHIAGQLRQLMLSRGIKKAAEVAEAAGVREGDVKSVLLGQFRGDLRILRKIATVFDVAISARFVPFSQAVVDMGWCPSFADEAQGIEAGTAETVGLGPKDESPVASGDAPQLSRSDGR
jgi:transcriptional regulator with XRE-family HTH domain